MVSNISGRFRNKSQMEVLKLKNTVREIKNSINRFNRILDIAEEKVSGLENISIEIFQKKGKRGSRRSVKCPHIPMLSAPIFI